MIWPASVKGPSTKDPMAASLPMSFLSCLITSTIIGTRPRPVMPDGITMSSSASLWISFFLIVG